VESAVNCSCAIDPNTYFYRLGCSENWVQHRWQCIHKFKGTWCDRVEINRPPQYEPPSFINPGRRDVYTAQSNTTRLTCRITVLPTTTDAGCRPFFSKLVNIRFVLVKAIVAEKKVIFINILSVSGMIFSYFYLAKIHRFLSSYDRIYVNHHKIDICS